MKTTRAAVPAKNENLRRRGTILVVAMIALLVVSMIGTSLVRTAVATQRQRHREQLQMQTELLAEAGCRRAVVRSQIEADYMGEEWTVPAEQLQSPWPGIVRISIDVDPTLDSGRVVTAVAEYPQHGAQKSRITRRIEMAAAQRKAE